MNPFDTLLIGTVFLCILSYKLGAIHGRKRARKSAASYLKGLPPLHLSKP